MALEVEQDKVSLHHLQFANNATFLEEIFSLVLERIF